MRQRNGLSSGMIQSTQGLGGGGYLLPSLMRRVSVAPNSTAVGLEVEPGGLAASLLDAEVPRGRDLVQCQIKLGRAELRKVSWWR